MNNTFYAALRTYFKQCLWYSLLTEDTRRSIAIADRLEYDTIPHCNVRNITRVIRIYIGSNLTTVRVRGWHNDYSVEVTEEKHTHISQ